MGDAGAIKRSTRKDGGPHGFHREDVRYLARRRGRFNGADNYHCVRLDRRPCHVAVAIQEIAGRPLVYVLRGFGDLWLPG